MVEGLFFCLEVCEIIVCLSCLLLLNVCVILGELISFIVCDLENICLGMSGLFFEWFVDGVL